MNEVYDGTHHMCNHSFFYEMLGSTKRADHTCVQATDGNGNNLLHKACHHGNFQLIKMLLVNFGAPCCSRNCDGRLPIDILVESCGNEEVRNDVEYVSSFYLLLRSCPNTIYEVLQPHEMVQPQVGRCALL